jgi:hypothetical protein
LRQLHADLARAEGRAERLLHDQAQSPGREQRVERTRIEVADQQPFDQQAERARCKEGHDHRNEEIAAIQTGKSRFDEMRAQVGHVGAEDHELAMRHVDHAHLAKDDGKPERHEQEHREQDEAGEALHHQDRSQIGERIVAEHVAAPCVAPRAILR